MIPMLILQSAVCNEVCHLPLCCCLDNSSSLRSAHLFIVIFSKLGFKWFRAHPEEDVEEAVEEDVEEEEEEGG